MPLVQARDLTKVYGEGETAITALDHVALDVEAGEFVAIMGPSGCGKSTMLHLLGGLDRATEGRVQIEGQSLKDLSDDDLTELRRRRIGFIFQFYNLIPMLDATENAALPILLDGRNAGKARQAAAEWLERVGLGDRLKSRPDQLSGGQQQRVAVARALVAEPQLILADEPTGNLDSHSASEIADLLRQIADEWERAVIMVTHDARIAAYADRILFLRDGEIVGEARPNRENGDGADWVATRMQELVGF